MERREAKENPVLVAFLKSKASSTWAEWSSFFCGVTRLPLSFPPFPSYLCTRAGFCLSHTQDTGQFGYTWNVHSQQENKKRCLYMERPSSLLEYLCLSSLSDSHSTRSALSDPAFRRRGDVSVPRWQLIPALDSTNCLLSALS